LNRWLFPYIQGERSTEGFLLEGLSGKSIQHPWEIDIDGNPVKAPWKVDANGASKVLTEDGINQKKNK
jgi:hypothetical protein